MISPGLAALITQTICTNISIRSYLQGPIRGTQLFTAWEPRTMMDVRSLAVQGFQNGFWSPQFPYPRSSGADAPLPSPGSQCVVNARAIMYVPRRTTNVPLCIPTYIVIGGMYERCEPEKEPTLDPGGGRGGISTHAMAVPGTAGIGSSRCRRRPAHLVVCARNGAPDPSPPSPATRAVRRRRGIGIRKTYEYTTR